ncbi:MAG: T9SS type A sorting domain-containing protein, partial [Candidatus Cloacimonetes bacterium]|nr:T9SS type A sorting domain-containing protein [Candidatus Cloacimonadota bacterium]
YFLSGFSLGFLAVTPVSYNPVNGHVIYYQNINLAIHTRKQGLSENASRYLHNSEFIVNFVARNVLNNEILHYYDLASERDETIDYLIITGDDYTENWQNFAFLYNQRGFTTEIVTVEYIESSYSGIDLAEKIRNFLKNKYEDNYIRFVLLAGDTDLIPHRGLYGIVNENSPEPTIDYDIPADMYYSCLDRGPGLGDGPDWNNNSNSKWGEPLEADLAPEFAIGRFCFNNAAEIDNFINKVAKYLHTPVEDELVSALFVGEDLGWNVWGGDYMDEMIGGSTNHGHETVGVPLDWNITTLYDRNYYWNQNDLFTQLNAGPNLINHLGHSSTTYTMKLFNSDVNDNNITNNGENHNFSIIFTQGCYGGAFDNRTGGGNYTSDCITEKFTSIANGTVAMIANSRYGWGSYNDTNGASQFYNREFVDAFFGEDIFTIGFALNDAKIDAIPFMNSVMYWACYELNLIGDPALSLWTAIPEDLTVEYPAELYTGADHCFVSCSEPGADVVILHGNDVLGVANTGFNGETTVYFNNPVMELTELTINVLKHNFSSFTGTITIIPANGPYVVCNDVSYSETGDYLDGSIQSLDIVNCGITLENIGLGATGTAITALLTTDNNLVDIIDDFVETNILESMQSVTLENAFQFKLLPGLPDGVIIEFNVEISTGENSWTSMIFLVVQGPDLVFSDYILEVTSGSDQELDPGETAELYLSYLNQGSGFSYNLATTIFCYNPDVTVTGYDVIPQIDPGAEATTLLPFTVTVSQDCPPELYLELQFLAIDDVGSGILEAFTLPIGFSGYNFENGDSEWLHYALSMGFLDEWHHNSYRNHTTGGSYSMKCGGAGAGNYSNSVHAALESPLINIAEDSYIKFHHWMDAEAEDESTAWDGGTIEISINGGEFEPVTPVGGYPYTIVNNPDSPFPGGTPVYSGSIIWEEVELDLSAYSGYVRLRFIFGSDAYVTGEGWYIDDIVIGSYTGNNNETIVPQTYNLFQNYPNPFNPVTVISFSIPETAVTEIDIYNIRGQKVKSLLYDTLTAGEYSIDWNGSDDSGNRVSSGIYLYRLRSGIYQSTRKMILMK